MVDTTLIGYIYGLYSTSDNLIRYIGYSHSPYVRHKSHLKESKLLKYRRHKWIQSELSKGFIKYNKLKKLNTIVKIKKEYVKKVRISGRHYKLTNKDVLFIKNNLLLTQKELSLRFNVSSRTIRRVLNK